MIHFIYHHPSKHTAQGNTGWQYRSRPIVRNTIRGMFNLKYLRSGLKMAYTVEGYGDSPVQKLLKKVDLLQLLPGLTLTVHDKKLAVWLRMNYDTVPKAPLKFVACYDVIDTDELEKLVDVLLEINQRYSNVYSTLSMLNSMINDCARYKGYATRYPVISDEIWESVEGTAAIARIEHARIKKELDKIEKERTTAKSSIVSYIESKKLSSSTNT